MKTIITLAGMILFMLCYGACRTSKLTDRQKTRLRFEEQSEIESRMQETNRLDYHKSMTDSNRNSYQLTIFPADTFKFSMQNGFIGKASKITLEGSSEQLIRVFDTTIFAGSITSELDAKMGRDLMANSRDKSTQMEKRNAIWTGLCIGLILGLAILGIWRKFREYSTVE